jgi:hypothetical protein
VDNLTTNQKDILERRKRIQNYQWNVKENSKKILNSQDIKQRKNNSQAFYEILKKEWFIKEEKKEQKSQNIQKNNNTLTYWDSAIINKLSLNIDFLISDFSKDLIWSNIEKYYKEIKENHKELKPLSKSNNYDTKINNLIKKIFNELYLIINYIENIIDDIIELYNQKKIVVKKLENIKYLLNILKDI